MARSPRPSETELSGAALPLAKPARSRYPPAMNPDPELASLRQEVAALRQEINALRRFITIETDEDTGEPRNMNLRCGAILFQQPEAPHKSQMLIAASEAGPVISLWDSQEKGRLILSVERDDPQVILHTAEGKEAVLLRADPADGRGYVAVLDNGLPRAVMKAAPDNAGVVSVVHDDGHARVLLHGTEDTGTFMTTNPDLKTTVKISSETALGGGLIVVNGPNGKPSVILSHHHRSGGLILTNGADGQPTASVPPAGVGKKGHEG